MSGRLSRQICIDVVCALLRPGTVVIPVITVREADVDWYRCQIEIASLLEQKTNTKCNGVKVFRIRARIRLDCVICIIFSFFTQDDRIKLITIYQSFPKQKESASFAIYLCHSERA